MHQPLRPGTICLVCMSRGCGHLASPPPILTPKQAQIIRLVGLGLANKEVAFRSGISANTVKFYLHAIFGLLAVSNRTEVALWARDHTELLKEPETRS